MNRLTFSVSRLARPILTKSTAAPRTFTTLTPLRPTLQAPSFAIRPRITSFTPTPASAAAADLVPRSAITASPMADMQIVCGPRNTMNRHTRLVQKRRLGFLARRRTKDGRKILQRRLLKGRKKIAQ